MKHNLIHCFCQAYKKPTPYMQSIIFQTRHLHFRRPPGTKTSLSPGPDADHLCTWKKNKTHSLPLTPWSLCLSRIYLWAQACSTSAMVFGASQERIRGVLFCWITTSSSILMPRPRKRFGTWSLSSLMYNPVIKHWKYESSDQFNLTWHQQMERTVNSLDLCIRFTYPSDKEQIESIWEWKGLSEKGDWMNPLSHSRQTDQISTLWTEMGNNSSRLVVGVRGDIRRASQSCPLSSSSSVFLGAADSCLLALWSRLKGS